MHAWRMPFAPPSFLPDEASERWACSHVAQRSNTGVINTASHRATLFVRQSIQKVVIVL